MRILYLLTPNYKNKEYQTSRDILDKYQKELSTKSIIVRTKETKSFEGYEIYDSNKQLIRKRKSFNINTLLQFIDKLSKIKGENLTLYADFTHKKSLGHIGFKDAKTAKDTLKTIRNEDYRYQLYVVETMINRAKYHPHQTSEMKEAIDIYQEWLCKKLQNCNKPRS